MFQMTKCLQSSARVQFSAVIRIKWKFNATYSLPLIFPLPLPLFALPFTFPLLVPLFKFPLLFPFPLPLLSPPVIRMRWLCHKFFFSSFWWLIDHYGILPHKYTKTSLQMQTTLYIKDKPWSCFHHAMPQVSEWLRVRVEHGRIFLSKGRKSVFLSH